MQMNAKVAGRSRSAAVPTGRAARVRRVRAWGGALLGLMIGIGAPGATARVAEPANEGERSKETRVVQSIYDFTLKDIDGKDTNLGTYKGKLLLLVNTASRCGFTPQYEGLEKLYEQYKDRGLVVLGFPANNFLGQEPGTNAEIKQFCSSKYAVTFPMFAKISVKGKDMHPLYEFLTSKETNPKFGGAISWNFNKFLIGRDGAIVGRFGSRTKPDDKELVAAVEKALRATE
jgi:glutathione peroxidase